MSKIERTFCKMELRIGSISFTAPFCSLRQVNDRWKWFCLINPISKQQIKKHISFFWFSWFLKDILLQSWKTMSLYFSLQILLFISWQKTKLKTFLSSIFTLFNVAEPSSNLFNFSRVKTTNIGNFMKKNILKYSSLKIFFDFESRKLL